jgi:hypothetical protein
VPAEEGVDDGADEVAVGVVGFLEGLTEVEEDIELVLEGVEAFFGGGGVEEHGGDGLQKLVAVDHFLVLQQEVDADIDDVEVDQFGEDLPAVPDIQQYLKHHIQALHIPHGQGLRDKIDEFLIESSVAEEHFPSIGILADEEEQFDHMQHQFFVEQQNLNVTVD